MQTSLAKLLFLFCFALCLLVPSAKALALPSNFFGVMSQENPTLADMKTMTSGGISTYRLPMSWDSVQRQADAPFDWSWVDATIKNTSLAGIKVLPIMMGTPPGFADNFRVLPIHNQKQKEGWREYLSAALNRYGVGGNFWKANPDIPYLPITTWQIWNEANFIWFTEPVSALQYYALLRDSHRIIKKIDPKAKIMLASLFAYPDKNQGVDATVFLRSLYKMGARKYFDASAIHPYSRDTQEMARSLGAFRKMMNRFRDRKKPLHITEIGWGSGKATGFDQGSPRGQARELRRGYSYLIRKQKTLGLASVYWFSWKDLPADIAGCNFCYSSGLFYANNQPKPAWFAFKRIGRK